MADEHPPAELKVGQYYANQTNVEPSFWDVRLRFGQLFHRADTVATKPIAEVTLPWAQAKLFSYYLDVNLILYEMANGKIHIRPDLLPLVPQISEEELSNPATKAAVDQIRELHERFMATIESK